MAEMMQTSTPTVSKALGTDFGSLPLTEQAQRVKTPAAAREAQLFNLGETQRATQGLAEQEGALAVTGAQQKLGAIEDYSQKQSDIFGQYKEQKESLPFPEFHPTKDNANDLMTLFSVIGMVGTGLGASGKNSSLGAMKAMTGMMRGYREGRADLFNREKAEFDKNFKAMQVKHEEIRQELDTALKLSATDKEKALAIADVAIAQAGSPILKEKARVQGLNEAAKYWGQLGSDLQSASDKLEERKFKYAQMAQSGTDLYTGSDGKTYTINKMVPLEKQLPEGVTLTGKVGTVGSGGGTGGIGAIQNRYNIATTGAVNALGVEIGNLASAPIFARPPALDNVLTDPASGVTNAVVNVAGRNITEADERLFQQLAAGASRAETIVMTQGRPGAATTAMFNEIGKQQPRAGDKLITTYLWLAQLKQTVNLAEKDLRMAGGNPEMLSQVAGVKEMVNNLIPYNVQDVTRVIRGGGKSLLDPKVSDMIKGASNLQQFEQNLNDYGATPRFATKAEAIKAIENGTVDASSPMFINEIDPRVPQRLKR